ncbi:MAG TPA: phosphoenolpyruvate carboxykinase (ATP) [Bacteriovoracaceae bacterium]|nr:phosphoenolpyruvate carboxykinase (ATP) [Bacteriovoracaceae bacterium]
MNFYTKLGLITDRPTCMFFNSKPHFLIQKTVEKKEGRFTKDGALVVLTGKHTGRCAQDRYVVKTKNTEDRIWWENAINPMTVETFDKLQKKIVTHLNEQKELFISERSVGADAVHNIGVRLVTGHPSHSLFAHNLFREKQRELDDRDFTILHAPGLTIDANEFGTRAPQVIVTDFDRKITLIVGTFYAGEIKKAMFSVLNYVLPDNNVLPMHAGANRLENGETGIFFGLSGTGKTTLSTDVGTYLIGDDEHGLSDDGVFNFEGGCYAKTYKLTEETEPEIWTASNRFGAMLENVALKEETGEVDFFDKSITENGRSSYPLEFIAELEKSARGGVAKNIFFLTADAFGVLPPVAKLTTDQAMFYFVLGYTAKLAGTEVGITEPKAAFSPCFGAPFMLRHPRVYADLLGHYLEKHKINVWLINTGWTGGAYGVGERFPLKVTREIVRSIQKGELNNTDMTKDSIFGFERPSMVPNVESKLLNPKLTWRDPAAYEKEARKLEESFRKNMEKFGSFIS